MTRLLDRPAVRRVGRRLRGAPRSLRALPPSRPVGAKLELTFACNLRCGFCYTDSPRHTLARTAELSDEQWLEVAQRSIDLGVLEAVLTGGEPLLRRELTLEVAERLSAAGVGLTLNTNGWFVDDEVARRFGALPGFAAFVSLDGPDAATHDSSRGVPGSWRRAVAGIDRLLARGVAVRVVHVVTPANAHTAEATTELAWRLGVRSVHLTRVIPTGAAARGGDWRVDPAGLRAIDEQAPARWGADFAIRQRPGDEADFRGRVSTAPAAFLVRPDGTVRIDSTNPYAVGHALEDGLGACWARICDEWRGPQIAEHVRQVDSAYRFDRAPIVPYLDADVRLGRTPDASDRVARTLPVARPVTAREPDALADPSTALAHVTALALARRYAMEPLRAVGEGPAGRYVRLLRTGAIVSLNPTAAEVMDACAGGAPAAVVERIAGRHPSVPRERIVRDVLGAVRTLCGRGVLRAAGAPEGRTMQAPEPDVDATI
jgi:MoaA/NifB/PqqE/SkfB family radical SAM enzyme